MACANSPSSALPRVSSALVRRRLYTRCWLSINTVTASQSCRRRPRRDQKVGVMTLLFLNRVSPICSEV